MEITTNHLHEDLIKLRRDVETIKNILLAEGELTEWAKEELEKAREDSEDSYTSLKDL